MTDNVRILGNEEHRTIAEVDQYSGHLIGIDSVHARVHAGQMFQADYFDAALANDGNLDLLVVTGATKVPHMRFRASLGGDDRMRVYEAVTSNPDGTAVPAQNRNRLSSETAEVVVTHTPTVSDLGTLLADALIPGGGVALSPGGTQDSFEEWILKTNTKYLFRLTNTSGGVQPASVALDWYEA